MNKPIEFWALRCRDGSFATCRVNAFSLKNAFLVREVRPTDLTPDEVIQKVCEFFRGTTDGLLHSDKEFARIIEANKEEILK